MWREMWHGDWSGADWALMSVAMLLFWTAVVAGIIWLVRVTGNRPGEQSPPNAPSGPGRPTAREILDERYARGELTDEEYRTRRDAMSAR